MTSADTVEALTRIANLIEDGIKRDAKMCDEILSLRRDLRALSELVAEDRAASRFLMGADEAEEAKAN